MTVGTQAAVLAGLDITFFVEFNPPPDSDWPHDFLVFARILKFFYYTFIVTAFCSNMVVVSQTTVLSVLGAGLALRGPDGSMMTATDGLYSERHFAFFVFALGLGTTLISVCFVVWIILRWEAAIVCTIITLCASHNIYSNYRRIAKKFGFDENDTVDFNDIMEGPANILKTMGMYSPENGIYGSKNRTKRSPMNGKKDRYIETPSYNPFYSSQSRSNPDDTDEEMCISKRQQGGNRRRKVNKDASKHSFMLKKKNLPDMILTI